jgi:hypothetical protein
MSSIMPWWSCVTSSNCRHWNNHMVDHYLSARSDPWLNRNAFGCWLWVGLVESVDCRARRPSSQNCCLPGCSAQNRTNHLTPDLKRPPLFCSAGFLTSQLNSVTRVKKCQAIIKNNKAIAIFFIFCELPANSCLWFF